MAAIIERIVSWGFRTRDDNSGQLRKFIKVTMPLFGAGIDLLGSRFVRATVNHGIAVGLACKPVLAPSTNPRKNRLIRYFNSLDPKKKRLYIRKLTYEYALRSLRRYRSFIENGNGRSFSYLTAIALSIGGRCNLACPSCVMKRFRSPAFADIGDIDYILGQGEQVGVAYVSVMGAGEPFLDAAYGRELLDCMKRHRGIDFFVYTNGTTLTEELARAAGELDNLLVLISVEGLAETHGRHRGAGTFARAMNSFHLLNRYEVPCGFTAVVHYDNYREVTSPAFVEAMAEAGALIGSYNQSCALFDAPAGNFARESAERDEYLHRLEATGEHSPIYVVDLFTLEEKRYGCRAKKGTSCFIDAVSGRVAPCMLFPFASEDSNIYDRRSKRRLEEILKDEFFDHYRKDHGERRLCIRDVRGELQRFLENPLLAREDEAAIRDLLEVTK